MQHPAQESAMTEVALALAMGFFSLMVLTLISMGVGDPAAAPANARQDRPAAALDVALSAAADSNAATSLSKNDILVVFDGTRFLDQGLQPLDPDRAVQQALAQSRRIVLAVDPTLSFERTMALRDLLKTPDLVVTGLTADWRARLAQGAGGRDAP